MRKWWCSWLKVTEVDRMRVCAMLFTWLARSSAWGWSSGGQSLRSGADAPPSTQDPLASSGPGSGSPVPQTGSGAPPPAPDIGAPVKPDCGQGMQSWALVILFWMRKRQHAILLLLFNKSSMFRVKMQNYSSLTKDSVAYYYFFYRISKYVHMGNIATRKCSKTEQATCCITVQYKKTKFSVMGG